MKNANTAVVRPKYLPRSFLYVPADQSVLFEKAAAGPADALILDLEDAVPSERKAIARQNLRRWFDTRTPAGGENLGPVQQQWVRVSAENTVDDLTAVVGAGLTGIFLAKCTTLLLEEAATTLSRLEVERGLVPGSVGVIGLVESAAALLHLDLMASNARLVTFAIGEVDLMADLRMTRSARSEVALDSLRARFVVSAAAAGLLPPVAPTSTDVHALDVFAETSQKMHDIGFRSRTAVHPKQVPIIHGVFTPSPADIAAAREVIACLEQAHGGVALDRDGRMIDPAVVRGAEEVLLRGTLAF